MYTLPSFSPNCSLLVFCVFFSLYVRLFCAVGRCRRARLPAVRCCLLVYTIYSHQPPPYTAILTDILVCLSRSSFVFIYHVFVPVFVVSAYFVRVYGCCRLPGLNLPAWTFCSGTLLYVPSRSVRCCCCAHLSAYTCLFNAVMYHFCCTFLCICSLLFCYFTGRCLCILQTSLFNPF